jgi:hypothetical protein
MIGGPFIMAARNSACQSALCASHNFHHSEGPDSRGQNGGGNCSNHGRARVTPIPDADHLDVKSAVPLNPARTGAG